jgi:hypothetical protein
MSDSAKALSLNHQLHALAITPRRPWRDGFGFNLHVPLGVAALLQGALSELQTHESFEVDQTLQFG